MPHFIDNFSKQAETYAKFRPVYPDELFAWLSTLTGAHDLAWDCGTGNGQAAHGLTPYFKSVYATDPSKEQLKNALPHPQITYAAEKAEATSLLNHTADLVTIAQALHWFNFPDFYAEVKRVVKPGGIIAAITYGLPTISPEIDALILHFHDHIVGEFWQPENRHIENNYSTIPFPFEGISAPAFTMQKEMLLDGMLGLLRSWSAVQKHIDAYGSNPIDKILPALTALWQKGEPVKTLTWQLVLKVGKIGTGSI